MGAGTSRVKELPAPFYSRYASLDEFLSAASSENNNSSSNAGEDSDKNGKNNLKKELGERKPTQKQSKLLKEAAIPPSTQSTGKVTKVHRTKNVTKITNKSQAQDFIEEMNRDYDHNICLDRFMHDIEQNQKQQTTGKEQNEEQQKSIDRNCNISPSNTSLSSSSSNIPNSNEDTDSSRNSESIKSSNQESIKNKGDANNTNSSNSSNASSNASNSEKEDKIISNDKDITMSSSKSSESGEKSTDQSSKHIPSIESGIGSSLVIADDETNSSQTGQSMCSSSASLLEKSKNYKGGKLGRKRKRGYIYNPQPVIEKPPKQFVPEQKKDQSYWDKRQRNNEAARRSREMRRLKEKETHDKLDRLKKENEALRVAITLLIQRNKNLEFIINELDKRETPTPVTVPISC